MPSYDLGMAIYAAFEYQLFAALSIETVQSLDRRRYRGQSLPVVHTLKVRIRRQDQELGRTVR